jgi:predicted MFS family arabinose efflux permease
MSGASAWRTPLVVLTAGGLLLTLSIGIRQSFGLFLQPMSVDLGWGREVFALAIAVQNLLWGATQPFVGALADRYGAGRVVAVGGACYALGLLLMSQTSGAAEFHFSAGLLVALGLSGTSFSTVFGVVSRVAPAERRSLALGIVGAGGSVGQFLMLPIGQRLIEAYEWRASFAIFAVVALAMILLAWALAGKPAAPAAAGPRQSFATALREACGHRGYLLLTAGFFVCGFHVTFIATHLPAYLSDRGVQPSDAATALALIGLFNIFGSLLSGAAGQRFSKKYVLSLIYAARAVAIAAFVTLPLSPWTAWIFAAVMGLLWLGTVPLTSGLVAQIFGPQYVSMLFGVVFFSHQVGAFLGAWLGGKLFDATGSYVVVWWIAVLLGVVAMLLHLPINERPLARLRAALAAE